MQRTKSQISYTEMLSYQSHYYMQTYGKCLKNLNSKIFIWKKNSLWKLT